MDAITLLDRLRDGGYSVQAVNQTLVLAVWYGYQDIAELQLAGHPAADPTWLDEDGDSALHLAAALGHLHILKLILETGAVKNVDALDAAGSTALALAAGYGWAEVVRYLLEAGNAAIDSRDSNGFSPLHRALADGPNKHRPVETVEALLRWGADIEDPTPEGGQTAVVLAAAADMGAVIRLLVDKYHVDLHARDHYGQTALWMAAQHHCRDAARQLLRNNLGNTELVDARCAEQDITALAVAVARNHEGMVRLLLDHDADTEIKTISGETPLHIAVKSNHESIVQLLLDRAADLTAHSCGRMPLDVAKREGHNSLIELLSEGQLTREKANVAFTSAAENGRLLETKRWLAKRNVHVDPGDPSDGGQPPLSRAAMNGHKAVVSLLLQQGADANRQDQCGHTALWWASWRGHEQVVAHLLNCGDADIPDHSGRTPLSAAAQMGHEKVVAFLLKKGANPVPANINGLTALDFAIRERHEGVVRLLAEHQTVPDYGYGYGDFDGSSGDEGSSDDPQGLDDDPVSPERTGNSESIEDWGDNALGDRKTSRDVDNSEGPESAFSAGPENDLLRAVVRGRVPAAKRLIRIGTDVDCRCRITGSTPLIYAASAGQIKMMELLLDNGADLEMRNNEGHTPLRIAAGERQNEAVRFLLQRGSDIEAHCYRGVSPLNAAAAEGHAKTVELLLEEGSMIESTEKGAGATPLHMAVTGGHDTVVRLLLERGANVECVDKNNLTPLLIAAAMGRGHILKLLMEGGADPSAVADGRSALCWAAWTGHEALLGPLIASGANVNHIVQPSGERPLLLAASQGHAMAVKILMENGARVDVLDSSGRSALSVATEAGHDAVIRLLSRMPALGAVKNKDHSFSSSPRYHYRPLQGNSSIRLLELQPASSADDILSFSIVHADLDMRARYQALSYEWKEGTRSVPVHCDDRIVLVTPNLKAALKRIRSKEGQVLTLWVDAVCINQDDVSERNQQVVMMARIFGEAEGVIMWLGDTNELESRHAQAAFGLIDVFGRIFNILQRTPGWKGNTKLEPDQVQAIEPLLSRIADVEDALDSFGRLCDRTYFTRAWVFQEMVLAARGLLMCGPHKCDWELFINAIWTMGSRELLTDLTGAFHPANEGSLLCRLGIRLQTHISLNMVVNFIQGYRVNRLRNLEDGVNAMVNLEAGDPRDKVYAALGLARDARGNDVMTLTPDYTLSIPQVYTMAARYFIRTSQNLSFWARRNRLRTKTTVNLPSWVPDWAGIAPSEKDMPFPLVAPQEWNSASKLVRGRRLRTTDKVLYVDGHLLDTVVFALPVTLEKDIFEDIVQPVVDFLASRNTGISDAYPRFANAQQEKGRTLTNLEALWNTITYTDDSDAALTRDVLLFLAWKISNDNNAGQGSQRREPEGIPEDLAGVLDLQKWETKAGPDEHGTSCFGFYDAMEKKLQPRADLVITERGYFAITGLGTAEPGMMVAVLAGADDFALLQEKREEDTEKKSYEYQDHVFMRETFERLDDIEEGARVERLEIR